MVGGGVPKTRHGCMVLKPLLNCRPLECWLPCLIGASWILGASSASACDNLRCLWAILRKALSWGRAQRLVGGNSEIMTHSKTADLAAALPQDLSPSYVGGLPRCWTPADQPDRAGGPTFRGPPGSTSKLWFRRSSGPALHGVSEEF